MFCSMPRPLTDVVYDAAGHRIAIGAEQFVADPFVQFEHGVHYFVGIAPFIILALCFANCICAEIGAMARNLFCWACR